MTCCQRPTVPPSAPSPSTGTGSGSSSGSGVATIGGAHLVELPAPRPYEQLGAIPGGEHAPNGRVEGDARASPPRHPFLSDAGTSSKGLGVEKERDRKAVSMKLSAVCGRGFLLFSSLCMGPSSLSSPPSTEPSTEPSDITIVCMYGGVVPTSVFISLEVNVSEYDIFPAAGNVEFP